MTMKIVQLDSKRIRFAMDTEHDWAPPEKLMDEIAIWCYENKCGKRISYDMFYFRRQEQMLMFMLKWG